MDGRRPEVLTSVSLTRRQALQLAAGATVLGLTGCAPSAREATEEQSQGSLVMISTQFQPVAEGEKMRSAVLAGFGRKVEFLGEELGPFEGTASARRRRPARAASRWSAGSTATWPAWPPTGC
jgi:hypothetical protein